ncbi:MAG: dTDP-4-dehydrorhamnose 3,5-epimerase family protein [Flavobacteriales bacterium]|nr:dTDP-4-dehydrorhamnose 3,5-epimerase family protein [Flavobacteriales bacterium]
MNNFRETKLKGVFEIDLFHLKDDRGVFVKTFHKKTLESYGLETDFAESFYSINNKNVVRGMHFQYPPDDHSKIVYCTSGALTDVILDIRKASPTYGQYHTVELFGENFKAVYLPSGTAHGFFVKADHTCMVYLTSTMHSPKNDGGILFDSFGYNWPVPFPIHSERDLNFPSFDQFKSPF